MSIPMDAWKDFDQISAFLEVTCVGEGEFQFEFQQGRVTLRQGDKEGLWLGHEWNSNTNRFGDRGRIGNVCDLFGRWGGQNDGSAHGE